MLTCFDFCEYKAKDFSLNIAHSPVPGESYMLHHSFWCRDQDLYLVVNFILLESKSRHQEMKINKYGCDSLLSMGFITSIKVSKYTYHII